MRQYVMTSLETHLFFGRIMKEHSLFLMAGFPSGERGYVNRANWFREQFENALENVVYLANGMVGENVLCSGEVVTEFTEMAEQQTRKLAHIPINIRITQAEKNLRSGNCEEPTREMVQRVRRLNQHILCLLDGLIEFKEKIMQEVAECNLYTTNYPLLVEHILREAKLYRQILSELEQNGCISSRDMRETEAFWNQIMMEHAQFIRGLLDPTEYELMERADAFANDYYSLLEEARMQDCQVMELSKSALATTEQYRDFKAAGTEGIIGCGVRSIILPLLADHVLREANHYLRILRENEME